MLIAAFGFVIMQALIKELATFHVFQIVFFRSIFTAIICILYLRRKKISIWGNQPKLLVLRAFFGLIAMTLFFVTIQRMPLGASVSLKYLSPIFTAIFAVIWLKEKTKWIQWVFFLTAFIGVLLLKGFDTRIDSLSLILGITGAIFAGLVYVTIRKIGSRDHSRVIVNYFMLSAAILSGVLMIPFWISPTNYEWMLLLLIGLLGYFAQIYMTKAFQVELASKVAQVRYTEVIYSLIIGFLWFGEEYSLLSLVGIGLILVSMLFNIMFKPKVKNS